ncbi:hypothetical protein H5410_001891 [Solanum commersonii]|uniref:Retrotransposon gag domain-containing protein n=1 Tax=Solanum commersonii TaxID=4109 RepID=A0A9J6B0B8_SOLCO|nr:hypothetical protein H5410_001891 [Solanum commersonii]
MEDHRVLKDFVDDSIREINDSIRKDLTEFCSMLLEVLGGKVTSFEPQNTVTNAKLWQFRGKNPEAWIVQAEHYFDFHKIVEDQKLNVASFYLDGEALKWYQWRFRNNQLIDWPYFADKVRIRFKQKGFESTGGRFANFKHIASMSQVYYSQVTYVHPQWRNITNSLLSQYNGEQSECKSNTIAHKVFDESSDRHKDANSLCTSISSVSKIENSCGDDVENEDKNDEEEIVTVRNKPIEFVIANANKPSFWINSIVSTTCDLSMFDICKALDDRWNQLFAYLVGLAQRWEEMPSISYTFNYTKLMSKGYDLKCLGSQSNLVGKGICLHVWDPGIHRQFVKLNNLNSGILFHIQTQDVLVNIKQLKRPICVLTVHQRESFLVGGGIEKWMVHRWNSQKVDHQQLFEIFEQEHEHVLAKWTTERCGRYRWVENLDGNNKIKCNMCCIVVHQEFHGVGNAQNLTSWFYLACAKLEFKKVIAFIQPLVLEVAYHNVDTMMNHIN